MATYYKTQGQILVFWVKLCIDIYTVCVIDKNNIFMIFLKGKKIKTFEGYYTISSPEIYKMIEINKQVWLVFGSKIHQKVYS